MNLPNEAPIQFFDDVNNISLFVKREDLIHPYISGNKWRKLYYNLAQAHIRKNNTVLTFGGAYSNHIHATAYACFQNNLKSIGVIRGEKHNPLNSTLKDAAKWGMQFYYMDRATYRLKNTLDVKDYLREQLGSFYLIPEGGSNFYGTNGCMEILHQETHEFDVIACPAGTGCTAAGIALSLKPHQKLLVFSALKGEGYIDNEIKSYLLQILQDEELVEEKMKQVRVVTDYHFGGYAKINKALIEFLQESYSQKKIKWDLIYNGKMLYGIYDLISKQFFKPSTKILIIHTGGLQGIRGLEERLNFQLYN